MAAKMYLEVREPNPMYFLKLLLDGAHSLLDVGCGL